MIVHLRDKHQALPEKELKDLITRELLERDYSLEMISDWTDHL